MRSTIRQGITAGTHEAVSFNAATTSASPAVNIGPGQFSNASGPIPTLNFGSTASPGQTFNISASTGIGGQFALIQLVNFTTNRTLTSGAQVAKTTGGSLALDDGMSGDGYPQLGGSEYIETLEAGYTGSFAVSDIPAVGLDNMTNGISTNQQFQTFLMYRPPGNASIWVTLQQIVWNWNGQATLTNGIWPVPSPVSTPQFAQNPRAAAVPRYRRGEPASHSSNTSERSGETQCQPSNEI